MQAKSKLTDMQHDMLKLMAKHSLTATEAAEKVIGLPGPTGRSLESLVKMGLMKKTKDGHYSQTAAGTAALARHSRKLSTGWIEP